MKVVKINSEDGVCVLNFMPTYLIVVKTFH